VSFSIDHGQRQQSGRLEWAWAGAILASALIHLALFPFSEPPTLFSDFYKAYWVAAEHLYNGGLSATYPFTPVVGNWTNLPVVAWPFALLVPLGRDAAGWVYLAIGYVVTGAAWLLLVRLARLTAPMAVALACLFFLNGPLLNSLREGNSTHWVLLFMVLGLSLWQERRDFLAGLAFGMCAAIKPALLLIGAYFFLRRRWGIVAGGATALAILVGASFALFGVAAHLQWYNETIAANVGATMPAFNVQSIDGFLIRFSTGATELLYFEPVEVSALHKVMRYAAFAAILAGFGWMMVVAERRGATAAAGAPQSHDLLQFSLLLLIALVISPVSWTHYYTYLLIPLALYLGGRLPLPDDAVTRWLFWTGIALTSLPVIMPTLTTMNEDPPQTLALEIFARTAVSAWLFGALLLMACFMRGGFRMLRQGAAAAPAEMVIPPRPKTA
jgi:alpha-1,2-mannosyltransferase